MDGFYFSVVLGRDFTGVAVASGERAWNTQELRELD